MLKKQTINKLNKLHEEALDNLTPNQIFLLTQRVTGDLLKDFNPDNKIKFENLMDYFMEKDIYTSHNALYGMFFGVDSKRISLTLELETYKLNDLIQMNKTLINEFNTNFKALKYLLSKIY